MAEARLDGRALVAGVKFYGCCHRCQDCKYLGEGNINCSCGHSSYSHETLSSCSECDCMTFYSPTEGIASCYHCGHSSISHEDDKGGFEERFLKDVMLEGRTHADIVNLYQQQFHYEISERTLRRKLCGYGIRKTQPYSDDLIRRCISEENQNGTFGYHRIHMALRTKHRLFVSRDRVHEVITSYDCPRGHDPKMDSRKLHTKQFISDGPNYIWSVDGHEYLAQPYGLYIYGIIDTFSRKIMAITVLQDKKMETVAKWMVTVLSHYNYMPRKMMIDKGGEWNLLKDELNIIQMMSIFNQRIECLWSQYKRMSDSKWFKETLQDLERRSLFDRHVKRDKALVYCVFANLLQKSLNTFREDYNAHTIRRQQNVLLPTGFSPNVMFDSPEKFNVADFREELESTLTDKVPQTEAADERYPVTDIPISKQNAVQEYLRLRESL